MTEEGLAADRSECTAIARDQAFLDNSRDRLRAEAAATSPRRDAALDLYGTIPGLAQLQSRYFRICMQARGYQRTPPGEGEERNAED